MNIAPDPELEAKLRELAGKQGVTPEALALKVLRRVLGIAPKLEPRDEWERRLFSIATDCGVSLPDEAFTSEALYD